MTWIHMKGSRVRSTAFLVLQYKLSHPVRGVEKHQKVQGVRVVYGVNIQHPRKLPVWQQLVTSVPELQLVMAERMTEEREKAITQVAESVGELAEIFKEIQVLVIDQGTILDRIDFNIEQAADRVGNAVVEINKANEYQKKSKTMLCIYLLLILCGAMVVVLILKKSMS